MKQYQSVYISVLLLGFSMSITAIAQTFSVSPSTNHPDASFGYHLAQDGNWLLVGAKDDTIEEIRSGSAYFFELINNDWVERQKVGPIDGSASDLFGISVALDGRWAVVGADGDDTKSLNSGAAYVYQLIEDAWVLHAKFLPIESGIGSSEMGIAVALKGTVMVVGAYSDRTNGQFAGAAYVYEMSDNEWKLKTKVLPEDGAADDKFGRSVHTDGNKVIIGGVLNDDDGVNSGSAYIFSKDGEQWLQEAKIIAPDAYENDRFGRSVGIDKNLVAIGSVLDDDNGEQSGSVYIFKNGTDGWQFQSKIIPRDGEADDFFGYALSFKNPYLLVGAHNDDDFGLNSGAAYLFKRDGNTWLEQEKIYAPIPQAEANFGESVCFSEDFLSFGSPYAANETVNTGMAFLKESPMITSLADLKSFELSVYPNPASNFVILDFDIFKHIETEIIITNTQGKLMYTTKVTRFPIRINTSVLRKGIYFLSIKSKLLELNLSEKIVIQ